MEIKQNPQFIEKGKKPIAAHPDFNDKLREAGNSGLTITPEATAEIVRLCAPEVAYWLAKLGNFEAAHRLMDMDADRQIVEVRRIAQQLEASGFANDPDTEDWINARRQAKREGKRR